MFQTSIEHDLYQIQKDFYKGQQFCERQEHIKVKLTENYDNNKYTEKELLKRLQYLQNGINLHQSFLMSLIISAVFCIISLFLSQMWQITLENEGEIAKHQYFLENNEYYAQGYSLGSSQQQFEKDKIPYQINDDWDKYQVQMYLNGYNYAINNGYGFNTLEKTILLCCGTLMTILVVPYELLRREQIAFNYYQTNDFEIELIQQKLGINKNCAKQYRVTINSQGQEERVFSVELKL